jgi:hypothetical protein
MQGILTFGQYGPRPHRRATRVIRGEAGGMNVLMVIFGFVAAFGFGPLVSFVGVLMMREGLRAIGYW